ncbi:MAG: LEA type 2 family protein [Gammaproteobacteria bacterium]|nr:LEA type 2 family protein [Gammaproteobacteria bacterium]
MPVFLRSIVIASMLAVLAACAGLSPYDQQPEVNITSFTLAPDSAGVVPRFNIGVQVINPNRAALSLNGMNYSILVDGNRILSGATADLPEVPGYGATDFVIEASPNLLGGARLFSEMLSRERNDFGYTFRARLDVGGIRRYINVEESGRFGAPAAN